MKFPILQPNSTFFSSVTLAISSAIFLEQVTLVLTLSFNVQTSVKWDLLHANSSPFPLRTQIGLETA
jgi:hypothetical protein